MRLRGTVDIAATIDKLSEQANNALVPGRRLTLVGFSFGAALAQEVAQRLEFDKDDGTGLDLVLFHGCSEVPVDLAAPWRVLGHFGDRDEFYAAAEVSDLRARLEAAGASVELHTYPGAAHMFTDAHLDEYDETASNTAWAHTLTFLG